MGKLYNRYISLVNNGDKFLKEIGFEEYLYMNSKLLKSKGFNVVCDEESVDKAIKESEDIWASNKINKIYFMPESLNIKNNELSFIDEEIDSDYRCNINVEGNKDALKISIIKSKINIEDIIKYYDKLKIKKGYTLQIYKVKYGDFEKGKIFAFKDIDTIPDVSDDNVIEDTYEIVDIVFGNGEENYLKAIESDRTPEGYLQIVLLKNKLDEICGVNDEYEIITKRTKIDKEGVLVNGVEFYYNENGNATIEYFKKYNAYNSAYKRVINVFEKEESTFKIVDQIVCVYM